jgi:hypothetical protein
LEVGHRLYLLKFTDQIIRKGRATGNATCSPDRVE